MKVMIVDDSSSMRMIVKRTLKQAGYDMEFTEAEDGQIAYDTITANDPELVLCDWNMPNMNGIEFLRKIRAEGNTVKFGFVTTESTGPMRAEAKDAGAQFLVAKPFTAESFEAALRPVIGAP